MTEGLQGVPVVALLGTRWAQLEGHGTRWRALVTRWADRGPVTVVDFPRFSRRVLGPRVRERESWLPGTRLLDVTVPVLPVAQWGRTADALRPLLPQDAVHVAATPLWAPLLPHLAGRCGFDAVDDWREHPAFAHLRARVEAGYRSLPRVDVVTAVSDELARRLRADYRVEPVVVRNGVDLSAYDGDRPAPAGLPDGPFAVYVGVIEDRVDLTLLAEVAQYLPVVVAGPARRTHEAGLLATGATWLGPVATGLVPGLLQRAAVGLVPHRASSFTASMDPMKVLEYLAAGLPVVATPGIDHPAVVTVEPSRFAATAARLAGEGRNRSSHPSVRDLDWDVVANQILGLLLGDRGPT
ncbi:MAG: glycosyltransferase [Mycobacteriales bacterium]|nr:glycosyltransferase [Mycobacteriales bacterium]